VNLVQENGQIPVFVQEVTRRKALSVVLENAVVTDKKGKAVDVSAFNDAAGAGAGAGVDDHEGHNH
jgi:trigger factor